MMKTSTITTMDQSVLQRMLEFAPENFGTIATVCKLWNQHAIAIYDVCYKKVAADIFGRELWMKHFSKEPVQYYKPSFTLLMQFEPSKFFLTFFPKTFKDIATGLEESFSVKTMIEYCKNVTVGYPVEKFHDSLTQVAQGLLPIQNPRWVKISKKPADKSDSKIPDFFDVFVSLHADYIKKGKSYFQWNPNSRTYKYKIIKVPETNTQYLMCMNRENVTGLFTAGAMPTGSKL